MKIEFILSFITSRPSSFNREIQESLHFFFSKAARSAAPPAGSICDEKHSSSSSKSPDNETARGALMHVVNMRGVHVADSKARDARC